MKPNTPGCRNSPQVLVKPNREKKKSQQHRGRQSLALTKMYVQLPAEALPEVSVC